MAPRRNSLELTIPAPEAQPLSRGPGAAGSHLTRPEMIQPDLDGTIWRLPSGQDLISFAVATGFALQPLLEDQATPAIGKSGTFSGPETGRPSGGERGRLAPGAPAGR